MIRHRAHGPQAEYGRPTRSGRGVVRTYGEGRRCSFPACPTVLSRYNENDRCWAHVRQGTVDKPAAPA